MARCITETAALAHRPERVLVVTITDGHENASEEFTHQALKKLVNQQQAEGWEFLYLSAALDAFADAQRMGIADGRMLKFSRNRSSMESMKSAMGRATDLYEMSGAERHADPGLHRRRRRRAGRGRVVTRSFVPAWSWPGRAGRNRSGPPPLSPRTNDVAPVRRKVSP